MTAANDLKQKKTKLKTRDNDYRKKRQEERKLKKLLINENTVNKPIVPIHKEGRNYTVSLAVPGSLLDNILTMELKTDLAGQIARLANIFCVDEIVIYDENGNLPEIEDENGIKKIDQGACIGQLLESEEDFYSPVLLAFLLKYFETPQYLQKLLFPQHSSLCHVGLVDQINFRPTEFVGYYEGLVVSDWNNPDSEESKLVDIGTGKPVKITEPKSVDTRVTLKLIENDTYEAVNRDEPRTKSGAYWGYRIRLANGLSGAITQSIGFHDKYGSSTDDCKYDLIIGTSERGSDVDYYEMPEFNHLLLVFGGRNGIENSMTLDPYFADKTDPNEVFNAYLNTCPIQGTRIIQTDEAMLISLSCLRQNIRKCGKM